MSDRRESILRSAVPQISSVQPGDTVEPALFRTTLPERTVVDLRPPADSAASILANPAIGHIAMHNTVGGSPLQMDVSEMARAIQIIRAAGGGVVINASIAEETRGVIR